MRTTLRINDELLRLAKERAVHEGRTLTSLVEEGLAVILAEAKGSRSEHVQLPISRAAGGVLPGVDLNRSSELIVNEK
jgi:hypothetical protein